MVFPCSKKYRLGPSPRTQHRLCRSILSSTCGSMEKSADRSIRRGAFRKFWLESQLQRSTYTWSWATLFHFNFPYLQAGGEFLYHRVSLRHSWHRKKCSANCNHYFPWQNLIKTKSRSQSKRKYSYRINIKPQFSETITFFPAS